MIGILQYIVTLKRRDHYKINNKKKVIFDKRQ